LATRKETNLKRAKKSKPASTPTSAAEAKPYEPTAIEVETVEAHVAAKVKRGHPSAMPFLKSPKHERFAQEVAKGTDTGDAYEIAGFKRNDGNARRLKLNEAIVRRVEALLGEREAIHNLSIARAIEATGITKAWVMERLRTNVDRAMQKVQAVGPNGEVGDFKYDGAVANRALELLGKELGMFVDRRDTKSVLRLISAEPLTADEWIARHGAVADEKD
jgi:hypothetical protein